MANSATLPQLSSTHTRRSLIPTILKMESLGERRGICKSVAWCESACKLGIMFVTRVFRKF
ncbi:unnamed protein product [Periconia digitata]|uniref:Uncharacterized protein n=1 Tax=Periconia digitata TaxID=1303443 RepID=A0A9W4UTN4_9PLEO|nr:unnamed protein product [Periconia digitata]